MLNQAIFISILVVITILPYIPYIHGYNPNKVWAEFNALDSKESKNIDYAIRNIPSSRFQDALDLLKKEYLRDELLNVLLHTLDDPEQVAKKGDYWFTVLAENLSVACFRTDTDEMVGVGIYKMLHKTGKKDLDKLEDFNPFEYFNIDYVLIFDSMVVKKEYRGQKRGIGKQLMKAAEGICKEYHLNVVAGYVTSPAGQKIARDLGYVEKYIEGPVAIFVKFITYN